jgi:hypothetical protein
MQQECMVQLHIFDMSNATSDVVPALPVGKLFKLLAEPKHSDYHENDVVSALEQEDGNLGVEANFTLSSADLNRIKNTAGTFLKDYLQKRLEQ